MSTATTHLTGKPWWQMPLKHSSRNPAAVATADKGAYGGTCQRIGCENPEAHWFNTSNAKHYCTACARMFNEICRKQGVASFCELRL